MKHATTLAALLVAGTMAAGCAVSVTGNGAAASGGQEKVVYHINQGVEQASDGIRNANNHLQVNPGAKIVMVTHARGVDFLMKGARDKNGNLYEPMIDNLRMKGVKFDICEITLQNRQLKKEQFIESASYIPSGVAEITRLQQRDGFAYVKP